MPSPANMPLFQRVAHTLRERLALGDYPLGIPLPGERALAQEMGVARITIRSALQRLQEEGLVTRLRGVGTMPVGTIAAGPHAKLQTGLLESIVSMGLRTKTQLLAYQNSAASAEVAQALRVAEQSRVLRIVRVRLARQTPLLCTEVFLPPDVAGLVSREALDDMPVLSVIERAGRVFTRGEQEMDAVNADPEVARLLKISEGSPVLRIKRVVFDAAGQPIQYLIGHYSPRHYQYKMSMTRTGGGTKVWIST